MLRGIIEPIYPHAATMNTLKILVVFSLLSTSLLSQSTFFSGGNICKREDWQLIFKDEFDSDTLNTDLWMTFFPCNIWDDQCESSRAGDGDIHLDSNVIISGGKLKLVAKHQTATWYSSTRDYTSGMIFSKSLYRFGYGKYELYGKIPSGKGLYPAFWLFGGDGEGHAAEIDVFEINGNEPYRYHPGIISYWHTEFLAQEDCKFDDIDLSLDFHLYSVEWEPFLVTFKIDNKTVFVVSRLNTISGHEVSWCCVEPGVYAVQPAYPKGKNCLLSVIVTLAVLSGDESPDNNTLFPSIFEIDYIRVYQRDTSSAKLPDYECVVTLFPNPTNSTLTIRKNDMTFIRVENALGKEILSIKLNADESEIDVSTLEKGLYFVLVNTGTDVLTGKFIKL
jgi:hypothetical protein